MLCTLLLNVWLNPKQGCQRKEMPEKPAHLQNLKVWKQAGFAFDQNFIEFSPFLMFALFRRMSFWPHLWSIFQSSKHILQITIFHMLDLWGQPSCTATIGMVQVKISEDLVLKSMILRQKMGGWVFFSWWNLLPKYLLHFQLK